MAKKKRIYVIGLFIIISGAIIGFVFEPTLIGVIVGFIGSMFFVGSLFVLTLFDTNYVHKTCFLVADDDWKSVLGLVPMAYRDPPPNIFGISFGLRIKCPLLIYHDENANLDGEHAVDADSVLDFLEKYQPGRLYLVGDEHQELYRLILDLMGSEDQVIRLSRDDYEEFWGSFDRFVVVDSGDYETALMASVYASCFSIPLFFTDKLPENVDGKTALPVGNVALVDINELNARGCETPKTYDLDDIISEYVQQTETDKIILVNPDDLNIYQPHAYIPEKTDPLIDQLYAKGSLAAPILAAGREEIILFPSTNRNSYTSYDTEVEHANANYGIFPKYLTIIGNPDVVPQSISVDSDWPGYFRMELDSRVYGSFNAEHRVDLATGRIYGISPSDVSGNIARSLFYKDLPRNRYAVVVPHEDHNDMLGMGQYHDETALTNLYRSKYWTTEVESEFDTGNSEFYAGSTGVAGCEERIRSKYLEVNFILYSGHGDIFGYPNPQSVHDLLDAHDHWFSLELFLNCPVVINNSCNTARWNDVAGPHPENIRRWQFAMQSIRRGAIAQIAVVSQGYWHQMWDTLMNKMYIQGKSVGVAFRCAKNKEWDRNPVNYSENNGLRGDPWFFLMGDPAFSPKYW